MIFLTVGTQLPFDRLVAAVDAWAAARGGAQGGTELFGQISDPGPSGYRPRHFEWVADLDPAAFEARFRAATHIVGHAGMGTIIGALGQGKPLLVMPRRAHLGEQRNDHQFATVQRLCTRPGVARAGIIVAFDAEEIADRINALLAYSPQGSQGRASGPENGPENGPGDRPEDETWGGAGAAPIARFAEKRLTDAIRATILD